MAPESTSTQKHGVVFSKCLLIPSSQCIVTLVKVRGFSGKNWGKKKIKSINCQCQGTVHHSRDSESLNWLRSGELTGGCDFFMTRLDFYSFDLENFYICRANKRVWILETGKMT